MAEISQVYLLLCSDAGHFSDSFHQVASCVCLNWHLWPVFEECILQVSFRLGAFKHRKKNVLFRLLQQQADGTGEPCGGGCVPGLLSVLGP